jgi:hypothetical protein
MQASSSRKDCHYGHVMAFSQDAKHANINTRAVKIFKAQFSHLSRAFHSQERFHWGSDGQQVLCLRFGMVGCARSKASATVCLNSVVFCDSILNVWLFVFLYLSFLHFIYLCICLFLCLFCSHFALCAVDARHLDRERETLHKHSSSLLQICSSCSKWRHHCMVTSHRPRQKQQAVRTSCLKITLVVKWDQSVPSVDKTVHDIHSVLVSLLILTL